MPSPIPLSRRVRLILSLLVLIHVAAVFAPPMAFQSRGPRGLSPSVSKLLAPLAAYGQFLYLDRGYAFFAPDPGPSHLMRVAIGGVSEDSVPAASGHSDPGADNILWYPDLNAQWPRLLYHRHFMLAEFLNDSYQPKLPAGVAQLVGPELPMEELRVWRSRRERYEMIIDSMTHRLKTEFGERPIQIDRAEHLLPDFVAYADDPLPLNDPSTYIVLEDISIGMDALFDLGPEALPPSTPLPTSSPLSPLAREPVPAPSGIPAAFGADAPSGIPAPIGVFAPSRIFAPSGIPIDDERDRPAAAGEVSR